MQVFDETASTVITKTTGIHVNDLSGVELWPMTVPLHCRPSHSDHCRSRKAR